MTMNQTFMLAILLGAAACSREGDSSGPDLRPEPRLAPVTLTTDAERYAPEAPGVLRVHNQGSETLSHGVCPELERREGDQWAPVDPAPHTACIMLAVLLQPGQAYEIRFTAPDAPGVYRYVLGFSRAEPEGDPDDGLRQTSNAFTVER